MASRNHGHHTVTGGFVATALAFAFAFFGAACVVMIIAGIPGVWLLITAAVLVDCLDWLWLGPGAPLTFHPLTIAGCALLAGLGELLEFLLSAAGAKRFGASPRGMWCSVIGGMLGAILGTFLILIPVIGTILGAALGTATGAVLGELSTRKKTLAETAKPALGAVIGRVLGTLAKLPLGLAVWVILAIAAFV